MIWLLALALHSQANPLPQLEAPLRAPSSCTEGARTFGPLPQGFEPSGLAFHSDFSQSTLFQILHTLDDRVDDQQREQDCNYPHLNGKGLLRNPDCPFQEKARLTSKHLFGPTRDALYLRAMVTLSGNYQKLGFGVNQSQDVALYFDTLDTPYGGAPDHVSTLSSPADQNSRSTQGPHPILWNTPQEVGILWDRSEARFFINGEEISRVEGDFRGLRELQIFNDRQDPMGVGRVEVYRSSAQP